MKKAIVVPHFIQELDEIFSRPKKIKKGIEVLEIYMVAFQTGIFAINVNLGHRGDQWVSHHTKQNFGSKKGRSHIEIKLFCYWLTRIPKILPNNHLY
ncbi:MAG: hypothetical protein F4073_11440 [Rhodobacteraceae bacterium]|nr:hypothetical protein [Paracoccaceae bacterium]MYI92546.1 hypothetical protein [Paracoccaceae bacterium]MYJ86175.1 hypothetical protein [Paracoccaceae bacterium]